MLSDHRQLAPALCPRARLGLHHHPEDGRDGKGHPGSWVPWRGGAKGWETDPLFP